MIRLADFDSPGQRRPAVPPRPVSRYDRGGEWAGPSGLGPAATARAEALRHGWRIVGADQAEHRFLQWQMEEDERLEAAAAGLAPGEAEGFAERIAGGYFERAKGFRETLPQAARAAIDERLARHEQRLFARASEIETGEQLRSARAGLDSSLQATLLPAVAAAAKRAPGDPDKLARLAGIEAEAARLIDGNPVLRSDEKEARKADALGAIHGTFAEALPEAERLDLDPKAAIETIGDRIRRLAGETTTEAGKAPSDADGFGRRAWLGLIRRYRPDLASGRSVADILALRADAELSAELREQGLGDAARFLAGRGHAATPGNLYLAHKTSPEGAAALLDADPGQAAAAIDPEAARDRPALFYEDGDTARPRTIGAVIAEAEAAMEGARPVDWRRRLAGVSPEMLLALSKDAGVAASRQAAEAKLADDAAYRTRLEDAERAIDEGGFGLADLQKAAGDGGWLRGGGDFERLHGRIAQRAAETLDHEKAVSKYTDPDYRFDPASPDDRAAVDLIYERGIAALEAGSAEGDEAAQRLLRQIVARTGIVAARAEVPQEPVQVASADGSPVIDPAKIASQLFATNDIYDTYVATIPTEGSGATPSDSSNGQNGLELAQLGNDGRKPRSQHFGKGRFATAIGLLRELYEYFSRESDEEKPADRGTGGETSTDQLADPQAAAAHGRLGGKPDVETLRQPSASDAGDFSENLFASEKDYLEYRRIVYEGVPHGFRDRQHVAEVSGSLSKALAGDGFENGRFAIRGSSVTGRKFRAISGKYDGPPFDSANSSDWDLAIVDDDVFEFMLREGQRSGISTRGGRTRTRPLNFEDLADLGLHGLADEIEGLKGKSGREISVVIYADDSAIRPRGPAMWLNGEE